MAFSAPHFENRPEILSLTSLRFFAAFEVVLGHIQPDYPFSNFLQRATSFSYQAVSFFFVLSGFVMVYAYIDAGDGTMSASKTRFWLSRFSRIAPAHYLALAILLPIFLYSVLVAKMVSAADIARTVLIETTFLQTLIPPFATAWNFPAWSLSVEACFYAAFPFLIGPCFRWPLRPTIVVTLALVAASAVIRLILTPHIDGDETWAAFVSHFPAFHFPQFILGVVTARLFLYGPGCDEKFCAAVFVLGIATVLVIALLDAPEWLRSDAVLAPIFAAIMWGATARSWVTDILSVSPLVTLGHASYAIYILHWPLRLWWMKLDKVVPLARSPWLDCGLYLAVVLVAALLTFFLIERPVRAYLLGFARNRFNH
jgi:peptidoglycan/LPS O-acetylase OafA/YrhL